MVLALSILVAQVSRPIEFPADPIASEMLRGEKVYYQHKGIDRTLMEDRVAVGKWFDGKVKRDTDQVIWLSPSMVSRWFGYLNAKEKWSRAELMTRWGAAVSALAGRMTFVAELFALPKQEDVLEITSGAPTKPETALQLRFLLTNLAKNRGDEAQHTEGPIGQRKNQSPLDLSMTDVTPIGVFKGYSLDSINRWNWTRLHPMFESLSASDQGRAPGTYDAVVGDCIRAVYLVQVDPEKVQTNSHGFELRIFAPGKDLVAKFGTKR